MHDNNNNVWCNTASSRASVMNFTEADFAALECWPMAIFGIRFVPVQKLKFQPTSGIIQ